MSFANPYFLVALAGVAAPVLIHLLTRDRMQRAAFSTLRFFAKGAKTVVRRKKVQEALLLALRIVLAALLALIFARPFFGAKPSDPRHEYGTARVVVLDVSCSMRRPGLTEAARAQVDTALDALTPGIDTAGVVTFSDTAVIAAPLSDKISDAKVAADAAVPGYGGTNIVEALRAANELLGGVRAKQKEIVLISDLQRTGWNSFQGDWKLMPDVKLSVNQVKPSKGGGGLAITELNAPSGLVLDKQPASIAVRIANYSDQQRNKVNVTLWLGNGKADMQQVNVKPGGTVAVRFRHVFDSPGDNPGSVVVGDDPPSPDNTVYFNARTVPRIPVLLVNGRPSPDPRADAGFFLSKALVPGDASPFVVREVTVNQVAPGDVAGATVVVLADVGSMPQGMSDALAALLDRGGGLFLMPGDDVRPEEFNAALGAVAPCRLRQVLTAHPANGETAESLTRIDFDHPIFSVFAQPHHGDMSLPKIARYWETTDTQLSHVLARFGDGRPAVIERAVGRGTSLAFVSAIDPKWNDLAYQSVFLPFVQQVVRYLAVQTASQTVFTNGDALPVPEGDSIKDPQGRLLTPTSQGKSPFLAAAPGFYLVLNGQGQTERTLAVNENLGESDPATMAGDEIAAALAPDGTGTYGAPVGLASPSQATAAVPASALWPYLVAGFIALSLAELVVGNRTLRH